MLALALATAVQTYGTVAKVEFVYGERTTIVSTFLNPDLARKILITRTPAPDFGYRIVWTPHVTLTVEGDKSVPTETLLRRFLNTIDMTYRIEGGVYQLHIRPVAPHGPLPDPWLLPEPRVMRHSENAWSIDLKDEEALAAIAAICSRERLNIEVEKGLGGKITLSAKDLAAIDAIRRIASEIKAEVVERETGVLIKKR